ncbi:hypothetical protein [Bradyrhizobium arachidis]|uniref:hypothetical protein n=1 Tax=Bradyrhizobium arachidis TaxID=858423 RepID=UPI0021615581|nr:hypothetical protein [Bradyrhizobium arachidis]UVO30472.1 hypothetical protein KUF59_07235 [Bradyrhizobium arachidis]
MEYADWGQVSGDLASTRRSAALFLDNLPADHNLWAISRRKWGATWRRIADAHCQAADLNLKKRVFKEAVEAWLCALTALEVANRINDGDDPQAQDISAEVALGIQRFGSSLERKIERTHIPCCDEPELPAYYLPAATTGICTPTVICISREEETGVALLGRLSPVVMGRSMSLLLISHEDI